MCENSIKFRFQNKVLLEWRHSFVSTFMCVLDAVMAELSRYMRDHLANKAFNICCLALYRKKVY